MSLDSKKAILVVSYGSSYKAARENSLGAIERTIADAFPEYRVCRAFTAESIIRKVDKRENLQIDTVEQALERLASEGVMEVVILQTHLVKGSRYEALMRAAKNASGKFRKILIANPILEDEVNLEALTTCLRKQSDDYNDGATAVCYVGHGLDADSDEIYQKIQRMFIQNGYSDGYVGVLSGTPSFEDIYQKITSKNKYRRVVIIPLMLVAGYHLRKDLMGPGFSWKNKFMNDGFEVVCVEKGMGEYSDIQNIFAEHLKSVIL